MPYWNTFYQEVRYAPVDAQDLMPLGLQYGEANDLAHRINQAAWPREKSPRRWSFPPRCREPAGKPGGRYLGQMDLNLNSPLVWDYYDETLRLPADYGAAIVRGRPLPMPPRRPAGGTSSTNRKPGRCWTV